MAFLFDWLVEKCRRPQNEEDDIDNVIAVSIQIALQDSADLFAFEEQVKEIIRWQLEEARENIAFEEVPADIVQSSPRIEEHVEPIQHTDHNSVQS